MNNLQQILPNKYLQQNIVKAFKQVLPVIFGYIPIGFAYGVLAQKNGLSAGSTLMMSLLVFAGSAQLIAVGLFAAGTGPASIIATTFIVNLRHLLMSASLAPFLKNWKKSEQAFFAFQLTDETFALHSNSFLTTEQPRSETLAINIIAQSAWLTGSFLGVMAGGLISDVKPIGLDYALPAMFIALLVWQLNSSERLVAALLAGGTSTVLLLNGADQLHVILATLVGATFGLGVHVCRK